MVIFTNTNYDNQWILLVSPATIQIGGPSKSTIYNRKQLIYIDAMGDDGDLSFMASVVYNYGYKVNYMASVKYKPQAGDAFMDSFP